jgi:LemA protein
MVLSLISLIVGMLALALLLYVVLIFNGIIQLKFNIEKAWANIDVLLKQRHDEVPNLVACVQGTASFEQRVMENVTKARAGAEGAHTVGEKAKAEAALSAAVGNLFVVAENYPNLKATENFMALQKRLSELENRIADRREFYNNSVANYNIRIQQFPDLMVAKVMTLQPRDMFSVSEEDKHAILVQFGADRN